MQGPTAKDDLRVNATRAQDFTLIVGKRYWIMDGMPVSPQLFVQQDMADGERYALAGGRATVFSTRSPGKPTVNEDAAAILPFGENAGVLVVADGLGGHLAGEKASKLALQSLRKSLAAAARNGRELRYAILNGIENANRAVGELSGDAATTLSVVEIQDDTVRPYHVGDSVILLVGNRGKVKLQTVSHSPVGYAVEAGLLDEQEAMHHEHRHLISNIIGAPEMRIEIGPETHMSPRDTLLIASDGLADNLHVQEIVELIRKGPLTKAAQAIADEALRRMQNPDTESPSKPDDLTFIVFRRGRS